MPGRAPQPGYRHPLTTTVADVRRVFESMGFQTVEGPEVELAYYNFDALNTSEDHPARDPQDTFYITDDVELRTQTSSVQIRTMQGKNRRSASSRPAACTATTTWTPRTARCFTRSRVF